MPHLMLQTEKPFKSEKLEDPLELSVGLPCRSWEDRWGHVTKSPSESWGCLANLNWKFANCISLSSKFLIFRHFQCQVSPTNLPFTVVKSRNLPSPSIHFWHLWKSLWFRIALAKTAPRLGLGRCIYGSFQK